MGIIVKDGRALMLGIAFSTKPDPEIVIPEGVDKTGNAYISGLDYFQRVMLPAPTEGFSWQVGVHGGVILTFPQGEAHVPVGRVNEPQRPLIVFLRSNSDPTHVSEVLTFLVVRPDVAPVEVVGNVALTTTGRVFDSIDIQWPSTVGSEPPPNLTRNLRLYSDITDAPVTTIPFGSIPTSIPNDSEWISKLLRAEMRFEDPFLGWRDFYSAVIPVTAAEEMRQLTASDIVLNPSEWRPSGQTTTFSSTFTLPGLYAPFEIQYRASPVGEDSPWFNVQRVENSENTFFLPDSFDPAYPSTNVALFRAGEARNSRLRFRWRRSASHPWSPDSVLLTVNVPTPPQQELKVLTSTDLVLGSSYFRPVGQSITFTPTFTLPGLTGNFEIEFKASPLDWTGSDPWSPVTPLPGQAGVWHLPDVNHPDYPNFNAALFRTAEPARNARLRFRWRPVGSATWSPNSDLFTVTPPTPVFLSQIPTQTVAADAAGTIPLAAYLSSGVTSYALTGGGNTSVNTTTGDLSYTAGTAGTSTLTLTVQPGGASSTFSFVRTEVAALQPPILAPLSEVSRQVNIPVDIDLSSFISGGAATSSSLTGGSWLAYNVATSRLTGTFPATAGTTSFTLTLSNAAGNSLTRPFSAIATAAPNQPSGNLQQIMRPSVVGLTNAMSAPYTTYRHGGTNGATDAGENIPVYTNLLWAHHAPAVVALGAFGDMQNSLATPNGTKIARVKLTDQINHWLGSSSTNNAPRGVNGYCGQYEGDFVITCLIAASIPGFLATFPAAVINRMDLCMIAQAIGAMYIGSDTFTGTRGWTNEANIRGFSSNRNGVLNFSAPPKLLPLLVDRYMVLRGLGRLNSYVQSFNRTTFANSLNAAGGLKGAYDTYRQTWTLAVQNATYPNGHNAFGVGPTEAQLLTSIRGSGGVYRCFNQTLDQATAVFQTVTNDAFGAIIKPGIVGAIGGEAAPGGSGWPTNEVYGLKDSATGNQLRACLMTSGSPGKGSWANVPNKGLTGRMRELDTSDGGASGVAWRNRSSISYALHGTEFVATALAAMICSGAFSPSDAGWGGSNGPISRIDRGLVDLEYIRVNGWRSVDKGRAAGDQNATWFANNGTYLPALTSLAPIFSAWLASA